MTPDQGVLSTSVHLGSGEILAAAEKYKQMGRWPIPIPFKEKGPRIPAWTELRLNGDEIERYFGGERKNIGILLGEPSDWTVDIDLDCREAIEIAEGILPPTNEIFGRLSKPRSHYIYRSPELTTQKFEDVDGSTIMEIRSTRCQTVFPPSVHESGEEVRWVSKGEPTEIPATVLHRAVNLVAVTALLARHWPNDGRHKLALAVSAVLARAGYEEDEIAHVLELICSHAGDEKAKDRLRTAQYAPSRIESGKPAYGIPTIAELLSEQIAEKVRSWLGLEREPKKEQQTERERVVEVGRQGELWHSEGKAFVTVNVDGHHEHMRVRSPQFQHWLRVRMFRASGKPPSGHALKEGLDMLEALGLCGPEYPAFLRVAKHEDENGQKIYIDLCNLTWQAIEVDARGWRIVDNPPVRFHRPSRMRPLPEPRKGGSIEELRQFTNLASDEFVLLVAAMMAALIPDIAYPILVLVGEQGSGKSTLSRITRSVLDPNDGPIRAMPPSEFELYVAAVSAWVLSFDNVSVISPTMADALCRMATGGAMSKRQLYTDLEEVLVSARRPIVLNGIPLAADRPDLLDRCVILVLPRMVKRRTEEEFWTAFQGNAPSILGAMLTAVSAGLRNLPTTHLEDLPRMADFARWMVAMEEALGFEKGAFMAAYERNREAALLEVAANDLLVQMLTDVMGRHSRLALTATDLLGMLNNKVHWGDRSRLGWPLTPNHLVRALRRLVPVLRKVGLEVQLDARRNERNVKLIELHWIDKPRPGAF